MSLVTRTTNSADYRDIDGRVLAARMREQTVAGVKELATTVIDHSEIVGKPAAFLLMAEGATVTVCHHPSIWYPWAAEDDRL